MDTMLVTIKGGAVLIEQRDYEKIRTFVWFVDRDGYATALFDLGGKWTSIRMHQLIRGKAPKGKVIDHKNRVKLDCRRSNLRRTSRSVNRHNRGPAKKGVEYTDNDLRLAGVRSM